MTSALAVMLLLSVIPSEGDLVASQPRPPAPLEIVPAAPPAPVEVWTAVPAPRGWPAPGRPHPAAQPDCGCLWGILGGRPLLPRYPVDQAYYRTHSYDLYREFDYPWNPPPAWKRCGAPAPPRRTIYEWTNDPR
ncbi:MAG: hypothetical protein ACOC46_01210 [Pirellulales bacterium]